MSSYITAIKTSKNLSTWILYIYFSIFVLLPFSRYAEIPVLILAFVGLYIAIKDRRKIFHIPGIQAFSIIFICYFLMILLSAADSYWMKKSWLIAVSCWRFFFAGLAVIYILNRKNIQLLWVLLTALAFVWSVDALIQYMSDTNLLGMKAYPNRLTGIFSDNVKLGPALCVLLPMVLIYLRNQAYLKRWLIVLTIITVIALSGSRSAWVMCVFILFMYLYQQVSQKRLIILIRFSFAGLILLSGLYFVSNDFRDRVSRTGHMFLATESSIDYALADRLPIWKTAINMFNAHPVNGVGARAFRKAYQEYAEHDDIWVQQQGMVSHAHHWFLETIAETGVIGLLLFIIAIVRVFTYFYKNFSQRNQWPFLTALMAVFLPIVSFYSMFSAFWSIVIWWTLIGAFIEEDNE